MRERLYRALEGCREYLYPWQFRKIYRDELIRRLAAAGHRQKDIAQAVGMTEARISQITKGKNLNNLSENPIKSTSAAEELEAKQREIERLRAEKEALAERERMEVQSRVKAEGELMSIRNQYEHLLESARKEQSKKVEYLTPPDVEDELASMQPVARKRTPRFKASFNVSRET